MRILFDNQIFLLQNFGGISRYFGEIFKMNGGDVQVQRIDIIDSKKENIRPVSGDIFSRGIRYFKRKAGLEIIKPDPNIEQAQWTISKSDFDIFHPTYYDNYFIEHLKGPFVITVYDMIHELYREFFSLSDRTSSNKKELCEKASAVITISDTTKSDLINIFKIDEEKVHSIHLASDFDKVAAVRPSSFDDFENYILFTGTRWAYKNFYFTLLALRDILKQDSSLQLVCTGHEFGADEIQYFSDLGLTSQVKHLYLDNDNELAWVYRHARLFIFPSLYEGFGFPLLEAFASDCPVVSSNRGSLKEIGGNAPIYFEPKNIKEIQSAVSCALYDNEVRIRMIEEGRRQFSKFSWEKCRLQTKNVYTSMLH